MTVINGVEIDDTDYQKNETKMAILNNDPIENKLHVIAVVSNPCLYTRRYVLMREFIERMKTEEPDVLLYIVELAYGDQQFVITDKDNKTHLQIRTPIPLWHKENMINVGVKHLLPNNWKAFAWIDSDLTFDSASWAKDTLKILNGHKDIVQLFSHCDDMKRDESTIRYFNSAGFQHAKGYSYVGIGQNLWHPGYAWAITRKGYEKIGRLFDYGILGAGDHHMALSLLGNGIKSINPNATSDYILSVTEFQEKCKHLRFGYVPGVIRHYFHGTKENRKYMERWKILVKHEYSPQIHVSYDENGILIPTNKMPQELIEDILKYFSERKEDDK